MPGSVRDIARALLAYGETRARLAAGEVEEQALRFAEIAVWAAIAFFFLGAGLVFVAIALVVAFGGPDPTALATTIALAFLAAGAAGAAMVRRRLRERPELLAATLAELAKDRARMETTASAPAKAPDA